MEAILLLEYMAQAAGSSLPWCIVQEGGTNPGSRQPTPRGMGLSAEIQAAAFMQVHVNTLYQVLPTHEMTQPQQHHGHACVHLKWHEICSVPGELVGTKSPGELCFGGIVFGHCYWSMAKVWSLSSERGQKCSERLSRW